MSKKPVEAKEKLYTQIKEAYGRVVYTYTTHLKQCQSLEQKNKNIKYVQIIFSAISTGGIISSIFINETIVTILSVLCSTLLVGINLYYKDFNSISEIFLHKKSASELWLIREQYISLLTDFDVLDEPAIRIQRNELQERVYELYKHTPKTDYKSYKAAQSALKQEEEQFFSTEELDKMLPSHLRTDAIDNKS